MPLYGRRVIVDKTLTIFPVDKFFYNDNKIQRPQYLPVDGKPCQGLTVLESSERRRSCATASTSPITLTISISTPQLFFSRGPRGTISPLYNTDTKILLWLI